MTRVDVIAWLARRTPPPPERLGAHLTGVVRDRPALSLADHLAVEGEALLARVAAHPEGGRHFALDLLAADAFVTYAFEAQAETDATALPALAARLGGPGTRA
jgi:hypothetical protein